MKQYRPSRRAGLQRGLLLGIGGWAAALTAGSSPDNAPAARNPTTASTPTPAATGENTTTANRIVLAYFSRPGENYYYGGRRNLDVGNTEVLARMIAELIDCDVHRIAAADPYPASYDATVARNVREQNTDARPAIADPLASIEQYDTVLLGSPIWNVRPPMIMTTFTENHVFTGKTVHPFVTYAVSGLGSTEGDYTASCPGARIAPAWRCRAKRWSSTAPTSRPGFATPDYSPPELPADWLFSANPLQEATIPAWATSTARRPRTTKGRRWTSGNSAPWRCRRSGWAAWVSAPTTAKPSTPTTVCG